MILEHKELLMIAMDQPLNLKEAVTSKSWREAMKTEINAIVKKQDMEAYRLATGSQSNRIEMGL